MSMIKTCHVYHKLGQKYSILLDYKHKDGALLFESDVVAHLTSSETDVIKKDYSRLIDAYGCLGVMSFNTYVGQSQAHLLVMVTACVSVGKLLDFEVFKVTGVSFVSLRNNPHDEESIVELKKLLASNMFYFARGQNGVNYDFSVCTQKRFFGETTEPRFCWNSSLTLYFKRFGLSDDWLLKIICGSFEVKTIYAADKQVRVCLISRLSCERAGTRFHCRGVDDDGFVANFTETEQLICVEDRVTSAVHIRGSVPLFWEQPGVQVGSHKIRMSRGPEASAPAFERHFKRMRQLYGDIVVVNLLGCKEGERMLSQSYQTHHRASTFRKFIPHIYFDYHSELAGNQKNIQKLRREIERYVNNMGIFYYDGLNIVCKQAGVVRTNCVDCLDRTNAVQAMIGTELHLEKQLDCLGLRGKSNLENRFLEYFKQIWIQNGDAVSRIYAGTGALGGGRSKFRDAQRNANRAIQNNFLDQTKQESINILLNTNSLRRDYSIKASQLLPKSIVYLSPSLIGSMLEQYSSYCQTEDIRVFVGTWNVNGGKLFRSVAHKHEHVSDWLLDLPEITRETRPDLLHPDTDFSVPIDIYAIGFEEIVDLNASNIVATRTTNQREWSTFLQNTLSRDQKYVLLTSVQLVGVCLYVFIRVQLAPFVREVFTNSVKTGMGGAAGNKGGVAVRFDVFNTSLCFVCSHFAAGQHNVKERNDDFSDICRRMEFPKRKGIFNHDYVFWCGDFNYRIDLPSDEIKRLINEKNWADLQACDQLVTQKSEGNVFKYFYEGYPNFAPTYKYDLFCNDYDTSEKQRSPAWTDRVLWMRTKMLSDMDDDPALSRGKLLLYNRAELKTSDHRPVAGIFDIGILKVDETSRRALYERMVDTNGPSNCTISLRVCNDSSVPENLLDEILELSNQYGEVLLVRIVDNTVLLTYQDGKNAVDALKGISMHNFTYGEVTVAPTLSDWKERLLRDYDPAPVRGLQGDNGMAELFSGDDVCITLTESEIADSGYTGEICDDEDDEGELDEDGELVYPTTSNQLLCPDISKTKRSRSSSPSMQRARSPSPRRQNDKPSRPPARPAAPPSTLGAPLISYGGHSVGNTPSEPELGVNFAKPHGVLSPQAPGRPPPMVPKRPDMPPGSQGASPVPPNSNQASPKHRSTGAAPPMPPRPIVQSPRHEAPNRPPPLAPPPRPKPFSSQDNLASDGAIEDSDKQPLPPPPRQKRNSAPSSPTASQEGVFCLTVDTNVVAKSADFDSKEEASPSFDPPDSLPPAPPPMYAPPPVPEEFITSSAPPPLPPPRRPPNPQN